MKCPKCGAENIAGSSTCENCGEELPSAAPSGPGLAPEPSEPVAEPSSDVETCANCGAERIGENAFCAKCGKPFPGSGPTEPDEEPEPTPEPTVEPSPAAGIRGVLEITTNGGEIIIDQDEVRLGRNEIRDAAKQPVPETQYEYISRVKADKEQFRIIREGDEFFIEDRGSSNGTQLNGQQIRGQGRQPLRDGDKITFAMFEAVFRTL
ncbi:MAG: FHA domain-containing protein [Promethearchaeota archaeon]